MTTRRGPRWPIPVTLLLAAALVGCDSRTPSSPPASGLPAATAVTAPDGSGPASSPPTVVIPRTSPCDLVYRDEASGLLGLPLEDSQEHESVAQDGSSWMGECLFLRRSADEIAPLQVQLAIGEPYREAYELLAADPSVTTAAGLGDDAQLRMAPVWGLDEPAGALFVRFGDAVLGLLLGVTDVAEGVAILPGDAAEQESILRELARIALARLSAPSTAVDPCKLVDAASASALGGPGVTTTEPVADHDVWGPGCAYLDAAGKMRLYVAVSDRASAVPNFETCTASLAEPIHGLAEAAFFTRSCQLVAKFTYMTNPMVMARFGPTVVTVTMPAPVGTTPAQFEALRAWEVAVARSILARLGAAPGTTPPPVDGEALAHACRLLSYAEVGARLGTTITAETEFPAEGDENAICYYRMTDGAEPSLSISLGTSDRVGRLFGDHASDSRFTPVSGIGDAAYRSEYGDDSDRPLVSLYVRQGDLVLELYIGGNGRDASGLRTAPGDPAAQLEMLRALAGLILSRATG